MEPIRRSPDDLDTQPSEGPRDQFNTTGELIDNFIDDNYTDILSSGSKGAEGAMASPGPVKIGHKKDGRGRLPHRFHVFLPPPLTRPLDPLLILHHLGFNSYLLPPHNNNLMETPSSTMDWYIPDGTNRRLVDLLLQDRRPSNIRSPGGGSTASVVRLPYLTLFYQCTLFLIDMDVREDLLGEHNNDDDRDSTAQQNPLTLMN